MTIKSKLEKEQLTSMSNLAKASYLLRSGSVIAIPTETVYGLAGNIYNPDSIKQIYKIKQRPYTSPLIVHTCSLSRAEELVAEFHPLARVLAQRFWPGPLTLLLEKNNKVPDYITSGHSRVAVRVPSHPMTLELLRSLPFPLAAPSANPFGYISPTTKEHVRKQLGSKIRFILDGGSTHCGLESTIVGFEGERVIIYRLGGIAQETLEEVVGEIDRYVKADVQHKYPPVPGATSRHYSPNTQLEVGNLDTLLKKYSKRSLGVLAYKTPVEGITKKYQVVVSRKGCLKEAAKNLFSALHYLDQLEVDQIIAPYFPNYGLGITINERLSRADNVTKRIDL